jgi:ribose 5-phosphate isomerase A
VVRQSATGELFKTDEDDMILDPALGPIADPFALAAKLDARTGIVVHGLYLGMATDVLVATHDQVEHHTPARFTTS